MDFNLILVFMCLSLSWYLCGTVEQSSPFGKFSHIDELISDLKRQLRKELREEGAHLQDKGNGLTNLNEIFELLHAIRQVREPEPQTNTARSRKRGWWSGSYCWYCGYTGKGYSKNKLKKKKTSRK